MGTIYPKLIHEDSNDNLLYLSSKYKRFDRPYESGILILGLSTFEVALNYERLCQCTHGKMNYLLVTYENSICCQVNPIKMKIGLSDYKFSNYIRRYGKVYKTTNTLIFNTHKNKFKNRYMFIYNQFGVLVFDSRYDIKARFPRIYSYDIYII